MSERRFRGESCFRGERRFRGETGRCVGVAPSPFLPLPWHSSVCWSGFFRLPLTPGHSRSLSVTPGLSRSLSVTPGHLGHSLSLLILCYGPFIPLTLTYPPSHDSPHRQKDDDTDAHAYGCILPCCRPHRDRGERPCIPGYGCLLLLPSLRRGVRRRWTCRGR